MKLTLTDAKKLAEDALMAAGASAFQAAPTANALVMAEAMGLASHGLSRVGMYAGHLRHNRVDGQAVPKIITQQPSAALIDAADGFAYPACELAAETALKMAENTGMAVAAVTNSHHFGAAGLLLQKIAAAGMVGIALGNSPAAMPFAGGKRAILGTNPIAAIFPRYVKGQLVDPVVIDLSLSEVARGKIMVAAKANKPIPLGWALDSDGNPTTDAAAALKGSMLPFGSGGGGVKGAMLALMVELLVTSLTGAHFGSEADSFFQDHGNKPKIAQMMLVINPLALSGKTVYSERNETLLNAILAEGDVRLPGTRRLILLRTAEQNGLEIPEPLFDQIRNIAKV
ncbi:MAG: Ldh family oxidoreductase [Alphaproteobacteria bacterium]|nr:Ldh family oxidoreductase [Alphaproteobacteria bacterium]